MSENGTNAKKDIDMAEQVKGFIVLRDFSAGIGMLSTLQKGQLMEALFADMEGEPLPELDPVTNVVLHMMLPSVHAAQNSFSRKRETARENGTKGGRPRKNDTESVSEKPNKNPKTESVSENLNRIDGNRIDGNRNIKNAICAEPFSSSAPEPAPESVSAPPQEHVDDDPPVAFIPLPGDQGEFPVSRRLVEELQRAYPGVDVPGELNRARTWSLTNPTKRKTARGVPRFLNAWMEREQNRKSTGGGGFTLPDWVGRES